MTDFASNLTFRFIASTIREAELWVKKLAEESLREAKLDMRSINSSCSSFSSSTSFPSPVATPSDPSARVFSFSNLADHSAVSLQRKSASFSDGTCAAVTNLSNDLRKKRTSSKEKSEANDVNVFSESDEASSENRATALQRVHDYSDIKTFPRSQSSKNKRSGQHHIRAQPHLGLNVVLDKHRPELRNVISEVPRPTKPKPTPSSLSDLPFSEYFVNVPST